MKEGVLEDSSASQPYLLPNFSTVALLSADGSTVEDLADSLRRSSGAAARPLGAAAATAALRDVRTSLKESCSRWTCQAYGNRTTSMLRSHIMHASDASTALTPHKPASPPSAATDTFPPPTTWSLTTWPPLSVAQPLITCVIDAVKCTASSRPGSPSFRNITNITNTTQQRHRPRIGISPSKLQCSYEDPTNAQQQLLQLESALGVLIPQTAYFGILELFWKFPEQNDLLIRWLLSHPANLSAMILNSSRTVQKIQRALTENCGIPTSEGITSGHFNGDHTILPQFREVLGCHESLHWVCVDFEHAFEVMGFLVPLMHASNIEKQLSPPAVNQAHNAWDSCDISPGCSSPNPSTPEGSEDGCMFYMHVRSRTPLRTQLSSCELAAIPEGSQSSNSDEEVSQKHSKMVVDSVLPQTPELQDSTHAVHALPSDIDSWDTPRLSRHVYSAESLRNPNVHSLAARESFILEEDSEEFTLVRNLAFESPRDGGPPDLSEENTFEGSEATENENWGPVCENSEFEEFPDGHGQNGWETERQGEEEFEESNFGAGSGSPIDDVDVTAITPKHREMVRALEKALNRVKM